MSNIPEWEIQQLRMPWDPQSDHTGYRYVYRCNAKNAFRIKIKLHAGNKKSEYLENPGTYGTPREAAIEVVKIFRRLYGAEWWKAIDIENNERRPIIDARRIDKDKWILCIWLFGKQHPEMIKPSRNTYFTSKNEALAYASTWLERQFPLFGHLVLGRT